MANRKNTHYRTDILQQENDLYVNPLTNDFDLGQSDNQHVNDIVISSAGWWKQWPILGVNIISFLKGKGTTQRLTQVIQVQVQSDGYKVSPSFTFDGTVASIQNNINLM